MSFIFLVSFQPFWVQKAIILIPFPEWFLEWHFLPYWLFFQVWFDPGIGYVLPGEVIEFHKQAGVKFLSLYHHPLYHHPLQTFPLQVAWAFPVYSEWSQSCWTTATLHSANMLKSQKFCWSYHCIVARPLGLEQTTINWQPKVSSIGYRQSVQPTQSSNVKAFGFAGMDTGRWIWMHVCWIAC